MSLRVRLRQALVEAMRARDAASVNTLRTALAAVDNAEAVPADPGSAFTEVARRELTEAEVKEIVRAEATERLAAAQLTAPAHADRVTRLHAEAAVLLRLLDDAPPE